MSSRSRRAAAVPAVVAACLASAAAEDGERPDPAEVRAAVSRSAGYVLRVSQGDGRFVYRRDLGWTPGESSDDERYNLLRHAGTMYALERYHDFGGDERVLPVLRRAAGELATFIAPVEKAPWTSAVWSDPKRLGGKPGKQTYAKLGGAGLALVALSWLEAREPDPAGLERLRALGRFVVFMQRADGGFHSRYRPETGFDESWHSLYYPGEAVLGLLSLHAVDPDPKWMTAAERGLRHLAEARADRPDDDLPPDHWILIATARYLERGEPSPAFRALLERHTAQIARGILGDAPPDPSPFVVGALEARGEVAPTATRIEGLFAALHVLDGASHAELRRQIARSTDGGIAFLLRAQKRGGPMDGAFARVAHIPPLPADPKLRAALARATEVRIDYVQHAMTALVDFLEQDREAG